MQIWTPSIMAFIGVTGLVFSTVFVFRYAWKAESRLRAFSQNASLAVFSTLYFFIACDVVFGLLVVQSDFISFSLSHKRWGQKYWNPINSQGYRDYEHNWKKNILFVVGDSFISGHGINHVDDRLAGVLAKKLGDRWTVAVLARNGWNTTQEYEALVKHPKKPRQIVFSYFLNDIRVVPFDNLLIFRIFLSSICQLRGQRTGLLRKLIDS